MSERYRGWLIETNWIGDWEATHPDFDGDDDNRYVTAKTLEVLKAEVNEWITEYGI